MGLTVHYEIDAGHLTADQVESLIRTMHSKAMDLPFHDVGEEILHFRGKECAWERGSDPQDETRWFKIQASNSLSDDPNPLEIIGFTTWPGPGCEAANFGLCRYPSDPHKWRWSSFCKTQYASNISVEHFLFCHTLLIHFLDLWAKEDVKVEVSDEGNYYEKRDLEALTNEIGEWNALIAGFSDTLQNSFGKEGAMLEAAIHEHPDYELLVVQGQQLDILKKLSDRSIEKDKTEHPERWN